MTTTMTNDKTLLSPKGDERMLLELSAKAAGISIKWDENWNCFMRDARPVQEFDSEWLPWRPLTDDGDALRLAVKLGLSVEVSQQDRWTFIFYTCCDATPSVSEAHHADSCAATRRAIVRAAAEIGKTL